MTIDEAEKFYKDYNCSLFSMAREDMINYTLYRNLDIDKALEMQWRTEVMDDLTVKLKRDGEIYVFNRLYDLTGGAHNYHNLMRLLDALRYTNIRNITESLCLAETIIGRKELSQRSGMIFWAYDIGEKKETTNLSKLVLSLIDLKIDDMEIFERINRDLKKVRTINSMLNIVF